MSTLALALPSTAAIGYPVLFGLILLGSTIPVVPTGPLLSASAALAMTTDHLEIVLVVVVAALAAWLGDLTTFAVARFGGPAAVSRLVRGQHTERLAEVRGQFRAHGWQIIVAGRLLPAGRIPVLVAAGALAYPWRRLLPATTAGASLWALAYSTLGIVSGGIFDSPLVATLVATALVLAVGLGMNLVSSRRRRRSAPDDAPSPTPTP